LRAASASLPHGVEFLRTTQRETGRFECANRTTTFCNWAEIRRSLSAAPALVTLDHHTDTYESFLRHRYHAIHRTLGDDEGTTMAAMLPGMIAKLRYDDEGSVLDAIGKL
jgi:hypothetical protein